MIRVFIVDDHAIVREGVKRIISDTADMEVAGEAGNGLDAIRKIPETECNVVLLDLNLPDVDGFDVLRKVKVQRPFLPVIVLSIYPEEDYALRAYMEGASGYLTKDSLPKDLIDAVRRATDGKRYISHSLGERLMDEATGATRKLPHEHLSGREFQILRMIIAGRSIKEMAAELSLAPTTVSNYRARILVKMNMKTNVELVRYAIDHHLMS